MKNKASNSPVFAFVDIETTGSHFERDRITEIVVKTLNNDAVSTKVCW
jgi:DNA polymerase-3 subunit epsilon